MEGDDSLLVALSGDPNEAGGLIDAVEVEPAEFAHA